MFRLSLLASLFAIAYSSNLPTSYSTNQSYEYVLLNAAVFATDPTQCVARATGSTDDWTVVSASGFITCPGTNETCGYLVIRSDALQQFAVVFRGSTGNQILDEVLDTFDQRISFFGGKVQNYFYNSFADVWPDVQTALSDEATIDYDVVVTGYSLGGAQAALCAANIVETGLRTADQIVVWTFGEPRVGNAAFSAQFDDTFKTVFRVVNKADMVPHLPPCLAEGFTGCFDSDLGYYHHSTEVWYPDGIFNLTSPYKICTESPEDPTCSNSLVIGYTFENHVGAEGYFQLDLQAYGEANCQS
ncbi:unnamed protein product [Bursaphelenchus okinawaensis]|uniref:Fungal lipase-type domain-containing protein n=1 Tax=Bursaphelenchus okinawaensis TaxID=465554 RepID=A0A811KKI3_9BILA|nr:unnamed protein product [Bursaphelenchus okinawaensis]CAG9105593.1 unnamed protein product [Bursaphelenchus okinawaensis]